jgi:PIN domain nuclease of toxin-antitoxin system
VKVLLDTHALIWAADGPSRLSSAAIAAIQDPANDRWLSAAAIWEIAIKVGLRKLSLSQPFLPWMNQAISDLAIDILPITVEYADVQVTLPDHHRDPFDRLMIAQAIVESLTIVSVDPLFDQYNVQRLW